MPSSVNRNQFKANWWIFYFFFWTLGTDGLIFETIYFFQVRHPPAADDHRVLRHARPRPPGRPGLCALLQGDVIDDVIYDVADCHRYWSINAEGVKNTNPPIRTLTDFN